MSSMRATPDVCIRPAPGVREREDILEQLALLIVGSAVEGVLLRFEVEGFGFLLVQQAFKKVDIHANP